MASPIFLWGRWIDKVNCWCIWRFTPEKPTQFMSVCTAMLYVVWLEKNGGWQKLKKFRKKCKEIHALLKEIRHWDVKLIVEKLNRILVGYNHYYGITDNIRALERFRRKVEKMLFYWLNRRSQKSSYTWKGYRELLKVFPIIQPRIYVSIYGW